MVESNSTTNNFEVTSLSKKELFRTYLRFYITSEMCNSYERLQATNFCITMAPHLEKWYANRKDEYIKGLQRHLQFFNTENTIGGLIVGLVLSMEEKKAAGADIPDEAITSIKTGLMGPIAGVGDALIRSTAKSTILAISCSLALSGVIIAPFVNWLYPALVISLGYYCTIVGYSLGREAISKLLKSGLFNKIIHATGLMGMFMMGALSSSFVKVKTALSFQLENAADPIVIQAILDKIVPGLLPLVAIFGIYAYFEKGGQKYSKLVWVILLISMGASILGILG